MTAHYATESAVEAIKKGATDYLNKPISISTLRERVGKLIEKPAGGSIAAAGRRTAGQFRFRGHYRPQPADVGPVFAYSPGCSALPLGADDGPDRDGQGSDRKAFHRLQPRQQRAITWC